MNAEQQRQIERLIVMAERLTEALEQDIDALKRGRTRELRIIDPEIQKLSAAYASEAGSLDRESARSAPAETRRRLSAAGERFGTALRLHMRHVARVRNASEGIIRAVAADVEKKRIAARPYTAGRVGGYRPPPGAIVFNSVV
jgi:hypothetical protein